MKIICNKFEFANLILVCDSSSCGNCAIEEFCEKESEKLGESTKVDGLISLCEIKEDDECSNQRCCTRKR